MVLEPWYDTRRVVQRYSRSFTAQFQGIVGHQFPRRRQRKSWRPGITPDMGGEWSWRPGITPDTGVGVVLEAWCYTRAAWTEVIHVAATGFQGIPDCIARYNSPRMWRRLAQYQRLLGASISKGRCHQYQGSVGDGSDWYTGIQSTHGVITFTLFILWSLS